MSNCDFIEAAKQTASILLRFVLKELNAPDSDITSVLDNHLLRCTVHLSYHRYLLSSPNMYYSIINSVLFILQVNDFLSGKSPLTLAMRLGNHMMFLQLQLSTVPPGSKRVRGPLSPSPLRGKPSKQPSPVNLAVPPRTDPSVTNNVCHDKLNLPRPLSPSSVMTPPPSPKSPSGQPSSPYTYPATNVQLPSPQLSTASSKDVTLDPTNTPPPSPCYVQKVIPNLPTIQINDETVPCRSEGYHTTPKAEGDIKERARTCPQPTTINDKTCPLGAGVSFLDNSTLAQAKRSLSMKLKEFSEQAKTEVIYFHIPSGYLNC
jgi:hypothetical protein